MWSDARFAGGTLLLRFSKVRFTMYKIGRLELYYKGAFALAYKYSRIGIWSIPLYTSYLDVPGLALSNNLAQPLLSFHFSH